MSELIGSFLSNESTFGRLMTRLGIIIASNLLFVLFSFPIVTAGAAYTALYHVMFKVLRGDGVLNPFKQFWIGFKTNFRQSTVCWLVILALVIFGYVDVKICGQAGGCFSILCTSSTPWGSPGSSWPCISFLPWRPLPTPFPT